MGNTEGSAAVATERLIQLSSVLGATGVGLGALGAHALQKKLVERGMLESWRTANLYHLFHATAILGVAALHAYCQQKTSSLPSNTVNGGSRLETAGYLMGIGSLLFSGSIYLLCLDIGPKKVLGPTTPIGGLLMLGGWGVLGFCSMKTTEFTTTSKDL
ncbi:hypothetical protein ACA910_022053 [Epithemia clementina (nom. ined.)]